MSSQDSSLYRLSLPADHHSFSVRARTLSALVSGIAASLANIIWGYVYDIKTISRPTLAKFTWGFFALFMLALFGWQVANEKLYSEAVPKVTLDWANPGFGRGFASMVLMRYVTPVMYPWREEVELTRSSFMNESHYMFVYWILGAFFDDIETLTLAVGIVRSFESVGSCLAFGIGAAKVDPMVNLAIAFAMFGITVPATSWAVLLVPERPEQTKLLDESSSEGASVHADPVTVGKAADAIDGPHP